MADNVIHPDDDGLPPDTSEINIVAHWPEPYVYGEHLDPFRMSEQMRGGQVTTRGKIDPDTFRREFLGSWLLGSWPDDTHDPEDV